MDILGGGSVTSTSKVWKRIAWNTAACTHTHLTDVSTPDRSTADNGTQERLEQKGVGA